MPTIVSDDLQRMRDAVFFEGDDVGHQLSRFWTLLLLASTIASAGVVVDSTATVIGAMIVAPLMLPIQGTMLSVVLGDRANLLRSLGLVVAGAAAAIGVGFLVGLMVVNDVVAETNAQVAGRVSPGLVDLLAALATGVVGSVALVRKDISDTLPGVAIAISLVPPLTVVGLTLEAGQVDQAAGAMLLFVTNVAAILGTGIAVMAIYGVHRMLPLAASAGKRAVNRRNAVLVIVALVILVVIPLAATSFSIVQDTARESSVSTAGRAWADGNGWELVGVDTSGGRVVARFEGPLPVPEVDSLRAGLVERGVDPGEVDVKLEPVTTVELQPLG